MGFGHRIYRAEDPRARVLRRTCRELGSPRFEAAEALEKAALAELQVRQPDRVLATNVEFWSAVVLDLAEVPPDLFTPMFTCARVAGWSAHILEQKREAKLIRPTAKYVGHGPRSVEEVERLRRPQRLGWGKDKGPGAVPGLLRQSMTGGRGGWSPCPACYIIPLMSGIPAATGGAVLLRDLGDDRLGREDVLGDRGRVLQRRARHHRRVDDPRSDEIDDLARWRR